MDFPELSARLWGRALVEHSPDYRPLLGMPEPSAETWNIALAHGFYTEGGETHRSSPITPAEIAASGYHYIALGHIHLFGDVSHGATRAFYCGTPAPLYASSEAGWAAEVVCIPGEPVKVDRIIVRNGADRPDACRKISRPLRRSSPLASGLRAKREGARCGRHEQRRVRELGKALHEQVAHLLEGPSIEGLEEIAERPFLVERTAKVAKRKSTGHQNRNIWNFATHDPQERQPPIPPVCDTAASRITKSGLTVRNRSSACAVFSASATTEHPIHSI